MPNEPTSSIEDERTRREGVAECCDADQESARLPAPAGPDESRGFPEAASRPVERHRLSLAEALDLLQVETARRQSLETTVREIEERFRQMSQHVGKFLWISDAESQDLIYVSPGFEEVWYRQREASFALPEEWLSATPPHNRERERGTESSHRCVNKGKDTAEYQIAGPDGSSRWIRDRMFPIRDSTGRPVYTLGIAEDITELKNLQEAYRRTERNHRALLSIVPDMIVRIRRDGTILEFKPAKDAPDLAVPGDLVGKNIRDLLPAPVTEQVLHYLQLTLSTGLVQTFTCQHQLPDYLRNFEACSVTCGEDEVLVIVRDVTDRKRLEKEILEISSREQQRIGQDLHDGLGQHLTGITFLSKALERKLAAKALTAEAAEAAEIARLVMQALSQTRNLARGLFPVELERNGLASALQELAANVERLYHIWCRFNCDPAVQITNNVVATHVFRIVQEAINNSCKHGKARHVVVSLAREGERVVLKIQDDGTGFPSDARGDGMGLRIMQYRTRRIGGTFDIRSGASGGTVVTVSFPY